MVQKGESRLSVIAAICANILIGIVKFIAAGISGSSAMVSEGVHSLVDSGNGILILYGLKRAEKKPDRIHPMGYGKELYFWTLVVAVSIFAIGGGVSLMKGITVLMDPLSGEAMGSPLLNYVVLGIALVIEGVSLGIAVKQFNAARGSMRPMAYIRECKDPSLYTVVLEDSAAELGLLFAFLGVFLGHLTGNHSFDAIASIAIGLLLMIVSVVLLVESKGLLIGEGLMPCELEDVDRIVEADEAVLNCGRIVSLYMGSHSLLLTIDAAFKPQTSPEEMLKSIARIESALLERFPQSTRIFIEAQSLQKTEEQHIAQVKMFEQ